MIHSLAFSHPEATPIGDRYAMQTRDGFTYYFFNLEPFDCHPADDRRAMLRHARRFGVPQADIMAAFHLVARAVKRYRERGRLFRAAPGARAYRHAPDGRRSVLASGIKRLRGNSASR